MTTLEQHLAAALACLELDPDPELADTASRVAELARAFCRPEPPPPISVCDTVHHDPVAVRDIPFHSLCVHHLLPFFGSVSVAYVPAARLAGLGSIPRLVQWHARKLTLQERLVAGVADGIMDALAPAAVVVACRARHMCVEMRGPAVPVEALVVAERGQPTAALRAMVG